MADMRPDDELARVEKWRDRLTPFTVDRILAIAHRESFAADVSSEARTAWANLAREAEALIAGGIDRPHAERISELAGPIATAVYNAAVGLGDEEIEGVVRYAIFRARRDLSS